MHVYILTMPMHRKYNTHNIWNKNYKKTLELKRHIEQEMCILARLSQANEKTKMDVSLHQEKFDAYLTLITNAVDFVQSCYQAWVRFQI